MIISRPGRHETETDIALKSLTHSRARNSADFRRDQRPNLKDYGRSER